MAVPLAHRLEPRALLTRLADGEVRSGAWLGRAVGTNRTEVARLVRELRGKGIDIGTLRGQGYRLATPVELLDAARIRGALSEATRHAVHRLDVLFEVDSTNTRLLEGEPPPPHSVNVTLSELQHAGRGRRGRAWVSPFGGCLALSLGWCADAGANPTLSLAVGVAVSRALERLGARQVRLKWPNDIWFGGAKMGGVLTELRAESGHPAHIVIGVGLNVSLSAGQRRSIESAGVRIATAADACAGKPSRNVLAATLLDELLSMLEEFERSGFTAFREEWLTLDALAGRAARLLAGDACIEGTARGVDMDGALLLEVGGRLQRHVSGEVSLRLIEGVA